MMSLTGNSLRGRKFEVYFKGQHVMHAPWESYTGPRHEQEKEVKMLHHDTHFSEADSIINDNGDEEYQFQFRVFKKVGKDGRYTPMKTYQSPRIKRTNNHTKYNSVSPRDDLLPGYYSWWSPIGEGYPLSLFGTIEFSANVDDLIECYKKAFDPPLEEIQFRCGGTLRYKIRVCKVIIICSKEEGQFPEDDYPVMPMKEAEIKLQYEKPYTSESYWEVYDAFTFVFHFSSHDMQMNFTEQTMICKEVSHRFRKCATKKGPNCPDDGKELPEQLKLKLENLKKRREQKSENVATMAQNVGPQATDDTESPLEEEINRGEGEMENDQEHVKQQLKGEEEEESVPVCEDKGNEDEDDEDQGPPRKKLAMTVDDDDL